MVIAHSGVFACTAPAWFLITSLLFLVSEDVVVQQLLKVSMCRDRSIYLKNHSRVTGLVERDNCLLGLEMNMVILNTASHPTINCHYLLFKWVYFCFL